MLLVLNADLRNTAELHCFFANIRARPLAFD